MIPSRNPAVTARKLVSVLLALVMTAFAAIVSLSVSQNAAALDSDSEAVPVAFTVKIPDGYWMSASAEVLVHAWPSSEVDKQFTDGDSFTLHKVATVTSIDGGNIAVHVAPNSIPAGYVNADGMVDFQVQVVDRVAGWAEMTELTSRSVTLSGASAWTDPQYLADGPPEFGTTAASAPTVDLVEAGIPSDDCEVEAECAAAVNVDAASANELAAACIIWGSEGSYVGPSKNVWAKVAATMALSTESASTARMIYSGSREHSTTAGVALSKSGVSYSSKGTKTVGASWGHSFANNRDPHRSYQIELRYGRYEVRYVEYDAGCGGTPRPGYGYKWRPRIETGGVRSQTMSRPTAYTHCVLVEDGTWYRDSSDYKAYSNSAGVDISGTIGIDLSSESQFGSIKKLEYNITGDKRMCGRSTVPSRDSVQMLRFR